MLEIWGYSGKELTPETCGRGISMQISGIVAAYACFEIYKFLLAYHVIKI